MKTSAPIAHHPTGRRRYAGRLLTAAPEAKQGWAAQRKKAIRTGASCAEKSIQYNPDDPLGYAHLGNLSSLAGDYDRALALTAKAASLGPSNQEALYFFGRALLFSGQSERGVSLYRRALEVGPRAESPRLSGLILAELAAGNVKTAAALAGRIVQRKHANPFDLVPATASFVADGRLAEARSAVAEIIRISPTLSIGDWCTAMSDYRDRSTIDRFSNLLAQAGLPS